VEIVSARRILRGFPGIGLNFGGMEGLLLGWGEGGQSRNDAISYPTIPDYRISQHLSSEIVHGGKILHSWYISCHGRTGAGVGSAELLAIKHTVPRARGLWASGIRLDS